MYPLIKALNMH